MAVSHDGFNRTLPEDLFGSTYLVNTGLIVRLQAGQEKS